MSWSDRFSILTWGGLVYMVIGVATLCGGTGTVHAQKSHLVRSSPVPTDVPYVAWKDCGLRKGNVDAFTVHRPRSTRRKRKTADITVSYGPGFPTAARDAYNRAVEIWETRIRSNVQIRIEAGSIEDPDENTLGGTIPAQFWVVRDGQGNQFIAGDALADALTREDADPDSVDMFTEFNFTRDDWHFGSDPAPAGMVDFTTVALHEIAHGLHYLSLCNVTVGGGRCTYEVTGERVSGLFSEQVYERHPDGQLTRITNEDEYPSSESLGTALTSDRLVFTGARSPAAAERSTGPVPPKVYAPTSFDRGSSLSHLDEHTYSFSGPNALMTPRVAPSETNRTPGPVVCGQLGDVGWPLGIDCAQYFQDVFNVQFVEGEEFSQEAAVELTWRTAPAAEIREYVVERQYFDESYTPVRQGITAPPVSLDSLGMGHFSFRVRWENADGSEGVSIRTLEKTVPLTELGATLRKRDQLGRAAVDLAWEVPPGTGPEFVHRVEQATGPGSAFHRIGVGMNRQFTTPGRLPGQYEYRIVSRDGRGNKLVSSPLPVEVSFEGSVHVGGPFPNPADEEATLTVTARRGQRVTVDVFNAIGKRVYREERGLRRKAPNRLVFDTRPWASGVYFIQLRARTFSTTQKMVVVH